MEWCRGAALGFALCLGIEVIPRVAWSQAERRLELHVIDSVSGAPVAHAEVRVIKTVRDSAGWGSRVTTDSTGRALVRAPMNEQLLMIVRRLGFAANAFQVPPEDTDDVFFVALAPTAAVLPATVTRAARPIQQLTESGFYDRRRVRPGVFLDSAAIAALKPLDIMSVIRAHVTGCTVIHVDGLPLVDLRDVDVRQVVGIEMYPSNLEAPPKFPNPMDSKHRCGTILIWQR